MLSKGIFSVGLPLFHMEGGGRIEWLLAGCPSHWSTFCMCVCVWSQSHIISIENIFTAHWDSMCTYVPYFLPFINYEENWECVCVWQINIHPDKHIFKPYVHKAVITTNHDYLLNTNSHTKAHYTYAHPHRGPVSEQGSPSRGSD